MENITASLQVIYHALEILTELDEQDLTAPQQKMLEEAMQYLEESRRLLYHEKNDRKPP